MDKYRYIENILANGLIGRQADSGVRNAIKIKIKIKLTSFSQHKVTKQLAW